MVLTTGIQICCAILGMASTALAHAGHLHKEPTIAVRSALAPGTPAQPAAIANALLTAAAVKATGGAVKPQNVNFDLRCNKLPTSTSVRGGFDVNNPGSPVFIGVANTVSNGLIPCRVVYENRAYKCYYGLNGREMSVPMGPNGCFINTKPGQVPVYAESDLGQQAKKIIPKNTLATGQFKAKATAKATTTLWNALCVHNEWGIIPGRTDGAACFFSYKGADRKVNDFLWITTMTRR